jgi:hypothetical protein
MIGAMTKDVFAVAWIALQGAYPEPEFAAAIAYLENEWFRHKEKFVHARIDHHLHFGHRATSKAEKAHALIKRELMVSTNDVVIVVNALVRTLKDQHVARKAAFERVKVNLPIKLLIPLFRDVVGKVAPQALHRMLDIRDKQLSTGVTTCRNPTLAKCGGEAHHLEKLEVWSPPGLPNVQSSTARPKTPRIEAFLVSLKSS